MQSLNEVFSRLALTRAEARKIRESYKDVLAQSASYKTAVDAFTAAKLKKTQIETEVKADFLKEFEQLDNKKKSMEQDKELLTDLAISTLMKGETVEIKDEHDVTYEPVFHVTFKKTK